MPFVPELSVATLEASTVSEGFSSDSAVIARPETLGESSSDIL